MSPTPGTPHTHNPPHHTPARSGVVRRLAGLLGLGHDLHGVVQGASGLNADPTTCLTEGSSGEGEGRVNEHLLSHQGILGR